MGFEDEFQRCNLPISETDELSFDVTLIITACGLTCQMQLCYFFYHKNRCYARNRRDAMVNLRQALFFHKEIRGFMFCGLLIKTADSG